MRKGNKLFVKWIIMYKKTALLCSVNISKNMEIIHTKILITNNLNYFCLMKKLNVQQMENVSGGWTRDFACNAMGGFAGVGGGRLATIAVASIKGGKYGAAAGPVGAIAGVAIAVTFSIVVC